MQYNMRYRKTKKIKT